MQIIFWTRTNNGNKTQARIYADIIRNNAKSVRIQNSNGEKLTIRKADIISIQKGA